MATKKTCPKRIISDTAPVLDNHLEAKEVTEDQPTRKYVIRNRRDGHNERLLASRSTLQLLDRVAP